MKKQNQGSKSQGVFVREEQEAAESVTRRDRSIRTGVRAGRMRGPLGVTAEDFGTDIRIVVTSPGDGGI